MPPIAQANTAAAQPGSGLSIAVIGAGLAGLSLAHHLAGPKIRVTLFDKGRGPGGRFSTRRAEDGTSFDHGAQYVTAQDPGFADLLLRLAERGAVAPWDGRIVRLRGDVPATSDAGRRWVGVPGMNALIRALADGMDVRFGVRVATPLREGDCWRLRDHSGTDLGRFDAVVVATPAPQAVELLAPDPDLAARAASARMAACWTLMVLLDGAPDPGWDGALIATADGFAGGTDLAPLTWVARNDVKPGRDPAQTGHSAWVLQAGPDWSDRHVEADPGFVTEQLLAHFQRLIGTSCAPVRATAHRWRYARPVAPLADGFLWQAGLGLGACGDWCLGAKAESAFLSGQRLAGAMVSGLLSMRGAA